MLNPALPRVLLSRVEDAGLNASAPPAQWWMDGWLVRAWPGKARRARCVNALAPGLLALDERLAAAEAVNLQHGVPLIFRITPFTQGEGLAEALAARGFVAVDPSLVLVLPQLSPAAATPAPDGLRLQTLDGAAFAEAVGVLRASPAAHRRSHAQRLLHAPVPHRGLALCRDSDGEVLACGQLALEAPWAGLYDVFTHPAARNQGLAAWLCERLLSLGASLGATAGYLQVDAANPAALAVYRRLGFQHGYGYHYLERPPRN